ncbi:MAG TPA: hypothetical protein VN753_03080 [Terracidiphilus sp.]|nr:hypothetical protein [Terracidiphilus sp.]
MNIQLIRTGIDENKGAVVAAHHFEQLIADAVYVIPAFEQDSMLAPTAKRASDELQSVRRRH